MSVRITCSDSFVDIARENFPLHYFVMKALVLLKKSQ